MRSNNMTSMVLVLSIESDFRRGRVLFAVAKQEAGIKQAEDEKRHEHQGQEQRAGVYGCQQSAAKLHLARRGMDDGETFNDEAHAEGRGGTSRDRAGEP